jgi:MFS family permease
VPRTDDRLDRALLRLAGWSVDRFGSKRMWMVSLALFLGGSALCGFAPTAAEHRARPCPST